MSNDGVNSYVYDAANRLVSASGASTASYVYDPFSRRASKTVNGTRTNYLYDGDQVIAEYNGAGTILRKFVFGPGIDEPIFLEGVDNRYYYHADALGSVVGLTNSTGAFAETYAYSTWGQVVSGSSVGNPFMYTGRRLDTETDLYYYRARQYSAELRRFLQPDPIGFAGGMNLYAYVGNSPLNYVDPWGRDGYYPDATLHGIDTTWGMFFGLNGGIEYVVNTESGEVSLFSYGGFEGGVTGYSVAGKRGAIWNLPENSEYSGPFVSYNGSVGEYGVSGFHSSDKLMSLSAVPGAYGAAVTKGIGILPIPTGSVSSTNYKEMFTIPFVGYILDPFGALLNYLDKGPSPMSMFDKEVKCK